MYHEDLRHDIVFKDIIRLLTKLQTKIFFVEN